MGVALKTRVMLWGRAAGRCAFPECRKNELVADATATDDESVLADIAHIVASSRNFSRGNTELPVAKRDLYDNLILLCKMHHKLVDDQPATYTVSKLKKTRRQHEDWVRRSLGSYDDAKQGDHEIYASYIDELSQMTCLAEWQDWSTFVLSEDQPKLPIQLDESLTRARRYLLSRIR